MFQIVLLLLALSVLIALYFWYQILWSYKGLQNIPRPPLLPFLGHGLVYLKMQSVYGVLLHMVKLQKELGKIFLLWSIEMRPYVILADINIVEYFMCSTKHISKSFEYKFLEPWLNKGLLTSTGSKWHKRRKMLTSTFHFKVLEDYLENIHKNGNILVEKLIQKAGDQVDIYPYTNLYALDVICETAMGTAVNAQIDENSEYLRATNTFLSIIFYKIFTLLGRFPRLYNLFSNGQKLEQEAIKIMHKFSMSVIEKRRKELLEKTLDSSSSSKSKLAFLDLLLQTTQDGEPLTNEDIREEVDTFMFEGHDTVTSALSFLLFELAKTENRHIQQKAYEEICEILGDNKNKAPTIGELQKLSYLELVVKEGLRLYPPVPLISRELEQDAIIDSSFTKGKPMFFPKGANVSVNAYTIHRNEEIYPEPEKFIPERFLKENWEKRSPFAYLPFSAGPRNCIGQKFAMLEVKATVTKVLLNFKLTQAHPVHVPRIYSDGILKSRNGLPIRLAKRI